jgi:hypothetical protein
MQWHCSIIFVMNIAEILMNWCHTTINEIVNKCLTDYYYNSLNWERENRRNNRLSKSLSRLINTADNKSYYHWVYTSAGELLVPKDIIRPVVSVSALTWLSGHISIDIYSSYTM